MHIIKKYKCSWIYQWGSYWHMCVQTVNVSHISVRRKKGEVRDKWLQETDTMLETLLKKLLKKSYILVPALSARPPSRSLTGLGEQSNHNSFM